MSGPRLRTLVPLSLLAATLLSPLPAKAEQTAVGPGCDGTTAVLDIADFIGLPVPGLVEMLIEFMACDDAAPLIYPRPNNVSWAGFPPSSADMREVWRDGSGWSYPLADFDITPPNCVPPGAQVCRGPRGETLNNTFRITYWWPDGVIERHIFISSETGIRIVKQHAQRVPPGEHAIYVQVEIDQPEVPVGFYQLGGLIRALVVH